MSDLRGKTILVIEDEFLISCMIVDALTGANATIVGPANTIESGLQLASDATFDAAILDLNLRGIRSDAIAEELGRRSIPFIVATGYGEASTMPGALVLGKPFTPSKLLKVLDEAMSG